MSAIPNDHPVHILMSTFAWCEVGGIACAVSNPSPYDNVLPINPSCPLMIVAHEHAQHAAVSGYHQSIITCVQHLVVALASEQENRLKEKYEGTAKITCALQIYVAFF